jgi:hypothetical protein
MFSSYAGICKTVFRKEREMEGGDAGARTAGNDL